MRTGSTKQTAIIKSVSTFLNGNMFEYKMEYFRTLTGLCIFQRCQMQIVNTQAVGIPRLSSGTKRIDAQ
jgi:hypothetical protein